MTIDHIPDPQPEVQRSVSSHAPKLKPWDRRALCRDLATAEQTRAALAVKYGISRSAVSHFAKANKAEIDAIKADLTNVYAGLWIADQVRRLAAYQADLELSEDGDYGSHYEQIRTRTAILKAVAEETGQLPARTTVTIIPVSHVYEGVDVEVLK